MNNVLRTIVLATAAALAAGGESAIADTPGPGEPTLAEVRAATEQYQDVKVALAEGYIRDPADMCETADMMGRPASAGAMGVHYFRPDLLGVTAPPDPRVDGTGTYTDFRAPLDPHLRAAGGRFHAIGRGGEPRLPGVVGDRGSRVAADFPRQGLRRHAGRSLRQLPTARFGAGNFAPHFDRHVWVYRENPAGVFEPLQPGGELCAPRRDGSDSKPIGRDPAAGGLQVPKPAPWCNIRTPPAVGANCAPHFDRLLMAKLRSRVRRPTRRWLCANHSAMAATASP